MRVLFYLVALAVGAQALSSQKRAGSDVCSNLKCPVSLANPVSGKSVDFGNMSEFTLLYLSFVVAQCGRYPLVDQCACLSGIPSLVGSDPILVAAASVFGTSKIRDYITNEVSHPPSFALA